MRLSAEFTGYVYSCETTAPRYSAVLVCPVYSADFTPDQFIPEEAVLAYQEDSLSYADDDFGFIDKKRV